jgi:hypothetical protein
MRQNSQLTRFIFNIIDPAQKQMISKVLIKKKYSCCRDSKGFKRLRNFSQQRSNIQVSVSSVLSSAPAPTGPQLLQAVEASMREKGKTPLAPAPPPASAQPKPIPTRAPATGPARAPAPTPARSPAPTPPRPTQASTSTAHKRKSNDPFGGSDLDQLGYLTGGNGSKKAKVTSSPYIKSGAYPYLNPPIKRREPPLTTPRATASSSRAPARAAPTPSHQDLHRLHHQMLKLKRQHLHQHLHLHQRVHLYQNLNPSISQDYLLLVKTCHFILAPATK